METKECSRCKEVKPVSEFYLHKPGKYYSWCKSCRKAYYQTPERKAYMKDYSKAYSKAYQQTPERKAANARYKKSDKGKVNNARYWKSEKGKATRARYKKSDKGKANSARGVHKRRTLMKELPCDLTAEQWEEIKASQNYRCVICGEVKPLERDHIIPLNRGGAFTKDNIQGLCRSCNSSKSNKIVNGKNRKILPILIPTGGN